MSGVGTIVLAAGESSRMGRPKQLLPYGGSTLLEHAVETALGLDGGPVVVVLGAFAETIRPRLERLPVEIVENAAWREGMGGSLRTGVRALLSLPAKAEAVLVTLCDQPLVTTAALASLVEGWRRTRPPIAAAQYDGILGVPALFDLRLFHELLALHGREGARQLIQCHIEEVIAIPLPAASLDIDTEDDFRLARVGD